MEIGSHGLTHVPLTGGADLAREVGASRWMLEDVVHRPVTGFCYPYGSHDDEAVRAVRGAGYGYACATGRPPRRDRFALPRTYVGDRDGVPRLEAKRARHLLAEARDAVGPAGARESAPTPGRG